MSITSKSPQRGPGSFGGGNRRPHALFPQVQPAGLHPTELLACLVLKKFFKTDYRGIAGILKDHSDLRDLLGLSKVPHFTTLQKAAVRLLAIPRFRRLLRATVHRALSRRRRIAHAAADSSGFDCGHASRYYVKRRAKGQDRKETPAQALWYTRYAKLELVLDTASM